MSLCSVKREREPELDFCAIDAFEFNEDSMESNTDSVLQRAFNGDRWRVAIDRDASREKWKFFNNFEY